MKWLVWVGMFCSLLGCKTSSKLREHSTKMVVYDSSSQKSIRQHTYDEVIKIFKNQEQRNLIVRKYSLFPDSLKTGTTKTYLSMEILFNEGQNNLSKETESSKSQAIIQDSTRIKVSSDEDIDISLKKKRYFPLQWLIISLFVMIGVFIYVKKWS